MKSKWVLEQSAFNYPSFRVARQAANQFTWTWHSSTCSKHTATGAYAKAKAPCRHPRAAHRSCTTPGTLRPASHSVQHPDKPKKTRNIAAPTGATQNRSQLQVPCQRSHVERRRAPSVTHALCLVRREKTACSDLAFKASARRWILRDSI